MRFIRSWSDRSYRRRLLDADLARVSSEMIGNVLELGAGRKRRRGTFRPPSHVSSWICADRSPDAEPDVRADVRDLPFRSAVFDTTVCLEVLEYVPEPARALRELARVLRPGGLLVVSVPFIHRWDTPADLWRASPAGLERLLRDNGLQPVAQLAQGGALAATSHIVQFVVRNLPVPRVARWVIAGLAVPLTEFIFLLDRYVAAREPVLRTLSTGYLVLARRR